MEWETPPSLFAALDAEFHFTLDVCARPENAKCERFFSLEDDGLAQGWSGTCFCNPPYGRNVGEWLEKAYRESRRLGTVVVCLVPARTDTAWFHEWGMMATEIRVMRGRPWFRQNGVGTQRSTFPVLIVIFSAMGEVPPRLSTWPTEKPESTTWDWR